MMRPGRQNRASPERGFGIGDSDLMNLLSRSAGAETEGVESMRHAPQALRTGAGSGSGRGMWGQDRQKSSSTSNRFIGGTRGSPCPQEICRAAGLAEDSISLHFLASPSGYLLDDVRLESGGGRRPPVDRIP